MQPMQALGVCVQIMQALGVCVQLMQVVESISYLHEVDVKSK